MPGFWSTIGLVQLPDSPLLELQRVGSDLVLRWPATAADQGFVLEQSGSVGTGASWSVVDNTASNVGVFRQLEIPVQPGTRFYRLQRP